MPSRARMNLTIAVLLVAILAPILMLATLVSMYVPDISRDEVARVPSPSGRFDAVLHETNGGATTSFGYEVRIVRSGVTPAKTATLSVMIYGAARSRQAYGVNLEWENENTLVAKYLRAYSVNDYSPTTNIDGTQIRVLLRDGIEDLSAPAGGMLLNLRERSRQLP